jgi:hypothetical protein
LLQITRVVRQILLLLRQSTRLLLAVRIARRQLTDLFGRLGLLFPHLLNLLASLLEALLKVLRIGSRVILIH